jgi:hypothetical protein
VASRTFYALVVAALVVCYSWFRILHADEAGPPNSSGSARLEVTERLRITDTVMSLAPGDECTVQRVPWRIDGYASRAYQIEWTVTHDAGRAWTWTHVTQDAQPQGDLSVLICPDVAGPGVSGFSVTGRIDAVTINPPAAGTSPVATGHVSVRVQG